MKKKRVSVPISILIDHPKRKKKSGFNEVSVEIDKLTNSIQNARTNEVFNTEFYHITKATAKQIKKTDWDFKWHNEFKYPERAVYKLTIIGNSDIIQGLISMEKDDKFMFLHLIESAKFNRGKDRIYNGVAGNIVAFACKRSMEEGFDGYVLFKAKTALIEHYAKTLGAILIDGQRMYIGSENAVKLVNQYFNS